ncbi:hypothetical protein C0989_002899 [Termitomyces sp. Mn162]|nr:hypothetical protein C0989_002899 [Termitomyces sp. Mn162]
MLLHQADSLLAAQLSVPAPFAVVYARFVPRPHSVPHQAIDRARRQLLAHTTLLGAFLTSVHIGHNSFIYVFAVTDIDATRDATQRLAQLQLDGLAADEPSYFTFDDLYPCSPACSLLSKPCPSCTNTTRGTLLPRKPLRETYSHFLEAIRIRLIDDIAQAASHSRPLRPVTRLKGGFLLGMPSPNNEWCSSWKYRVQSRPLLFCQLQVHLCQSRLIIHPLLHITTFLPLLYSLPVPPGTPITLLPHGTPAFFLTHYNGPTSALTKQFQESLQGLGVGSWSSTSKPSYIIAWINVENKQGEDKGIVLIYPTALCLSFTPSSIPRRPPLEYIPSLPTALQPSPQMSAQPPPSSIPSSTPHTPHTPPLTAYSQPKPVLPSSPSSDSVRAFRALALSKSKDIHQVAAEVAGYVDAVARDREKERERLKRERENNNNSVSTSPKFTRLATASAPTTQSSPISSSAPLLTTPLSLMSQQPVAGTSHPPPPNFYPSPPQADATPHTGPTSPPVFLSAPSSTLEPVPISSEPPPAPVVPPPLQSTFDPFGSTDVSWTTQPQSYLSMNMNMDMDMDMDFEMSMGMDMNMSPFDVNASSDATFGGPSRTGDTGSGGGLDFDDTAFTDDDFSFFDRPSAPAAPVPLSRTMPNATTTAIPTPAAVQTPLSFGASSPLFTTDIPSTTPHNASAPPWVSTFGAAHTASPAVPDLLPPSPGPTPSSHSAPATPTATVHLEPFIRSNSTFDPIPFADYHRVLDGKYAVGKFSLPSPPQYPDDRNDTASPGRVGWRKDYMAATDPRIGVVRKLIGVKRKLAFEHGGKVSKSPISTSSPSWVDDWSSSASTSTPSPDAEIDSDSISSVSSRSPSPSPSPPHSRPTTPPPAYLPLGPTLLSTHFTHSTLLPLSTPLRRPSSPLPLPPPHPHLHPAASALTPVSPAATLGQSKSLEAAAGMVATEVVENPPWAEAWRASTLVAARAQGEVWLADVRATSQLLGSVPGLEGSMTLGSLFCDVGSKRSEKEKEREQKAEEGKGKLKMLEAPMITIGKGDAVIQILPTALRFWQKLGLGPKGGAKNGTVYMLFEDDGEQRMQQVEAWLESVATNYEARHFGTLIPGENSACMRDGVLPLRFDSSFRKTLASLITSLPASQFTILFIVIPMSIMTLASPTLRQIFSAVTKTSKTYSEAQIHFQFVPEQLLHDTFTNPAFDFSTSDICCSIYDRILVPVDRLMSRSFEHGVRVRKYFQQPALTLARPIYNKATFVRAAHASLDVMDRDTFLHVGYQVSQCGKWILAACVDQRGEAHDLGVWLMQTPGESDPEDDLSEMSLVQKVWEFAIQFAKKANVEWRMVFSKLGAIGENELDGIWIDSNSRGLRISSFTILAVEPDTPWTFISTQPQTPAPTSPPAKVHNLSRTFSSAKVQPQNIFTDITSTIFATTPYNHLSQFYPLSFSDLGIFLSHVPEDGGQSVTSGFEQSPTLSLPHLLPLLPRSSTTLICIPATHSPTSISMLHLHLLHSIRQPGFISSAQDISSLHTAITHNFHELAVLAYTRWRLNVNPILPIHLAAVEAMQIALSHDQYGADITDSA